MPGRGLLKSMHLRHARAKRLYDTSSTPPTPTFDEWLDGVFDHPELPNGWYDDDGEAAKAWDGATDPVAAVIYQTRLFEDPTILIGRYTPQQIGFGLNYLRQAIYSSHVRAFVDARVPLEFRVRGVRAIGPLYELLFATLIDPDASTLEAEGDSPRSPMGSLSFCCFMWWDTWVNFPFWLEKQEAAAQTGGPHGHLETNAHPDLVDAGWAAMKQALDTGHRLCIEAALHGLGHWHLDQPNAGTAIIDEFLAAHPSLPPNLREYAMRARCGDVQ